MYISIDPYPRHFLHKIGSSLRWMIIKKVVHRKISWKNFSVWIKTIKISFTIQKVNFVALSEIGLRSPKEFVYFANVCLDGSQKKMSIMKIMTFRSILFSPMNQLMGNGIISDVFHHLYSMRWRETFKIWQTRFAPFLRFHLRQLTKKETGNHEGCLFGIKFSFGVGSWIWGGSQN